MHNNRLKSWSRDQENFDIDTILSSSTKKKIGVIMYISKEIFETKIKTRAVNRSLGLVACAVLMLSGCGGDSYASKDSDGDGVANATDAFATTPLNLKTQIATASAIMATTVLRQQIPTQADKDGDGTGDACDTAIPTVYGPFVSAFDSAAADSVSYTGQTARQLLILSLVRTAEAIREDAGATVAAVTASMDLYVTGNDKAVDSVAHGYTLTGQTVIPGPTFADISSGKNLNGKIAGGNGAGGGETTKLINDEFFGWDRRIGCNSASD